MPRLAVSTRTQVPATVTCHGVAMTAVRRTSSLQAALALVAATVLAWRAVRTANGQGAPDDGTAAHVLGATITGAVSALTVSAAIALLAGRGRVAAAALSLALALELFVLDRFAAPPRLVTSLPLALALVLFLANRTPRAGVGTPPRSLRTAAGVVSLLLMLPIGFLYLMSGLVVPTPDLYGMYALFAVLLASAGLLARRRSWWVLAVPPAAAALWFALIWLGGQYWGWQP